MQKPSGWQPDCPVSVVTELGAGAAVSESSGDSQWSWRGCLEADRGVLETDRGLHKIECLREGKGERKKRCQLQKEGSNH